MNLYCSVCLGLFSYYLYVIYVICSSVSLYIMDSVYAHV